MPHPVLTNGGTSAEWYLENPILPADTTGTETDTGKTKIGNGTAYWNSLEYVNLHPFAPDIPIITWEQKGLPGDLGVGLVYFSDLGPNGSMWFCNGSDILPLGGTVILDKELRPGFIIAGLAALDAATYTQSGNTIIVTSTGHTISSTLCEGADIYLPILTGLATAGVYSDFSYVDANTFSCKSTINQTTSGSIATNLSTTTAAAYTVKGGLMGPNGNINIYCDPVHNNGAEAKTITYKCGSKIVGNQSTTTTFGGRHKSVFKNYNYENKQLCFSLNTFSDASTTSAVQAFSTIDTSVDFNIVVQATVLANSWVMLTKLDIILER